MPDTPEQTRPSEQPSSDGLSIASMDRLAAAIGNDCSIAFARPDGLPLLLVTRLLACGPDALRFACPLARLPELHGRVAPGSAATVNVRVGDDDLYFCSRLERFEPGPSPAEFCLRLATPGELIATQRRQSFRLRVGPDDRIAASLWRIDDHALVRDRPKPSQELACTLHDLSTGGLRALIRAPRLKALGLTENQRFRVGLLAAGAGEMIFEGRLRYPRRTLRDDASAVCGIRFVHRAGDIESRRNQQKLQVVLGHLQRQAAARRGAA